MYLPIEFCTDVQEINTNVQVVRVLIEIGYVMDSEIVTMAMMKYLQYAKLRSKFGLFKLFSLYQTGFFNAHLYL